MKLVYMDECDDEERKNSSVTACIFDDSKAADYRAYVVGRMRAVFRRSENDCTPYPILHASALPQELDDNHKIELFGIFADALLKFGDGVVRVGYAWQHPVFNKPWILTRYTAKLQARQIALLDVQQHVWRKSPKPLIFLYEQGFSNFDFIDGAYNMAVSHDIRTQIDELEGAETVPDLSGVVGSYYSRKHDHFMYAADFASYWLHLSEKTQPSEFQRHLINVFEPARSLVKRNEIHSH
jgi:hypothetical protein